MDTRSVILAYFMLLLVSLKSVKFSSVIKNILVKLPLLQCSFYPETVLKSSFEMSAPNLRIIGL